MSRQVRRFSVVCGLLVLLAGLFWLPGVPAEAETSLSPFVKRLDRPEKYLYVFCVDADAKDHDFLALVDVESNSPTFRTITYQLHCGSEWHQAARLGSHPD